MIAGKGNCTWVPEERYRFFSINHFSLLPIPMVYLFLLLSVLILIALYRRFQRPWPCSGRATKGDTSTQAQAAFAFSRPKPPWVRNRVIRLKALMPEEGCRTIATTFNRIYEGRENISKSWVALVIKRNSEQIVRLRKEIKRRVPRPLAKNTIWALDFTLVSDSKEPILAVLDHGTRVCLAFSLIPNKSALAVLATLIPLMRKYGKPKILKTDNDGAFRSYFFQGVLKLLGVKHRRSQPYSPWQNGRVERLILTMKERLLPLIVEGGITESVHHDLQLLRFWYNHVRPHQHLEGNVPGEVWRGGPASSKSLRFFSHWRGLIAGYYRPPP